MPKQIAYSENARRALEAGMNKLADAVRCEIEGDMLCAEQCGVLVSQVRLRVPCRIGLDLYEWLFWPRLYPPRSALCINDNSLSRSSPRDAAGDRIHSFPPTLGRRRNLGEGDGWCFLGFF